MKRNSKLSVALHCLLHLAKSRTGRLTSEELAKCVDSNPVIIRRILGELRETKIVGSEKGHGGGWYLEKPIGDISLLAVVEGINERLLPTVERASAEEKCVVATIVSDTMADFMEDANSLLNARLKRLTLKKLVEAAH